MSFLMNRPGRVHLHRLELDPVAKCREPYASLFFGCLNKTGETETLDAE
jgi:hypothetical protein